MSPMRGKSYPGGGVDEYNELFELDSDEELEEALHRELIELSDFSQPLGPECDQGETA
jgi:ADP-ribose pyrophosphatase YjhB (NUDIX family)